MSVEVTYEVVLWKTFCLHWQIPLLGNSARPVQLAHQSSTTDQEEISDSFSFLEKKGTKASAFDFVQDEMKARMKSSWHFN